jgi:hypothetical protein
MKCHLELFIVSGILEVIIVMPCCSAHSVEVVVEWIR